MKAVRPKISARILGAALLVLPLAGEGGAWAQGLDFKVPEFEFYNSGKTFGPGEPPYAEIRNFQKSLYPNLRARLFRKDEVVRRPRSVAASGPDGSDRCYIFSSTLLRVRLTSSEIYLVDMPRTSGDWVVIFESGEWTKGPIKLSARAVDEYFRHGFSFSTERPAESWNPLLILALLTPQRMARQEAARQKKEEEEYEKYNIAHEKALKQAADDPLCVWFRTTSQKFLVAEKRLCGGCPPEESLPAETAEQWLARIAMAWAR